VAVSTVLYDEDCGFCRWSADRIRSWDRHGSLRFATLRSGTADTLLGGLDDRKRYGSWHLVTSDGRIFSADAAVPELLSLLPGGRYGAAVTRSMPGTTGRIYAFVSRHRERLGRLLGESACAVYPGRAGR
jgi:predicted DCC family thiol-disulfide oxidoreductase YuxK